MFILLTTAFVLSLITCYFIVSRDRTASSTRTLSADLFARQASHLKPTPRIGGIALAISVALAPMIFSREILGWHSIAILVSALPIFLVGLREDLRRDVSSKARYVAAIASGLLAAWLLQTWIDRSEPAWFSQLLAIAPLGIAITVFTTASYSHAFNLIDGLNGLCSGTALIIAIGLGFVAVQAGEEDLVPLLLLIVAGLAGFFLWNFPAGKIFLGDAGAYSIGHVLSWVGVVLIGTTTEVSSWAIMLIFFWPLADTLFAISRRLGTGQSIDTPDRMHFHQLVMRTLRLTVPGLSRQDIANPLATAALMPFISAPVATGVIFWNDSRGAAIALVLYGIGFVLSHWLLRKVARKIRRRPARNTVNA